MSFTARCLTLFTLVVVASCSDDTTPASRSIIALRFVQQPSTVKIDTPFSATVELLGPDGERALNATDLVSLSLIGAGTLSGTATVVPTEGVATFTGLRVSAVSESLQLKATAAGITATSPTFKSTDDCAPTTVAFPIVLTGTLANALCIVDGRPAVFYRFTRPELGPVQFTVTAADGAFVPEIAVLNDPPSDFIPTSSTGATATDTWILPAAMYRLKVAALAGTAGPFTVTTNTSAITGCVRRTLLPFAFITYPDRIDAGDCTENGKNYDWYQVYAPKSCTLIVRGTAAAFDGFISVRNARTHTVVAEDDNAAGGVAGKDAGVMLTECRAGTDPIEIIATVSNAAAVGDYGLVVQITGGVSLFSIGPGVRR